MVVATADPVTISNDFVELVLKHQEQWKDFSKLSSEDQQIIINYLSAAGFKFTQIEVGDLISEKSEDYPEGRWINSICPYKVMNGEHASTSATEWLNAIVNKILHSFDSTTDLVTFAKDRLCEAVPLAPIQLTPEGDLYTEYPPSAKDSWYPYFLTHTHDSDKIANGAAGVHAYCGGWIENKKISETHHILHCRNCNLRVPFPEHIKTHGELRVFFQTKLAQDELRW